MNYTIASIKGIHTGFEMDLSNSGQKYVVFISQYDTDDETKLLNRTKKEYADRREAHDAFLKLTVCILEHTYSFEDRAAML